MAKRALSWKRAAAIGWRDLKSAPGKFGFVVCRSQWELPHWWACAA